MNRMLIDESVPPDTVASGVEGIIGVMEYEPVDDLPVGQPSTPNCESVVEQDIGVTKTEHVCDLPVHQPASPVSENREPSDDLPVDPPSVPPNTVASDVERVTGVMENEPVTTYLLIRHQSRRIQWYPVLKESLE